MAKYTVVIEDLENSLVSIDTDVSYTHESELEGSSAVLLGKLLISIIRDYIITELRADDGTVH